MKLHLKSYLLTLSMSLVLLSTIGVSSASAASLHSTETETIHINSVKVKDIPLTQQECLALAKEQHINVLTTCTAQLVAHVSGVVTRLVRHSASSQVAQSNCISGTYLAESKFIWDGGILYASQRANIHYNGSCNLPKSGDVSNHNCFYDYGATGPGASVSISNCSTYTTTSGVTYIEQDMGYSGNIAGIGHAGTVWDTITFVDGDGDWNLNQSPNP